MMSTTCLRPTLPGSATFARCGLALGLLVLSLVLSGAPTPVRAEYQYPNISTRTNGPNPHPGSMTRLDRNMYFNNVSLHGQYDFNIKTTHGHSFHFMMPWQGRRYFIHYFAAELKVFDVTDALHPRLVDRQTFTQPFELGFMTPAYHAASRRWIVVQALLNGLMDRVDRSDPTVYERYAKGEGLRGIRISRLVSVVPFKLETISEYSVDGGDPKRRIQGGTEAAGYAYYDGGRYAYLPAAPDHSFIHTENSQRLFAIPQMVLDLKDLMKPTTVSMWWVPGQRRGEEAQYRQWRQFGDGKSALGAKNGLQVPVRLEDGGRYGYTAMNSHGFYVVDLKDPHHPKTAGSLDFHAPVGGFDGHRVDATRATTTGIVLVSGEAINLDCYAPYKDVFVVDVKDPQHPRLASTLPRPEPPPGAPFADFCDRRGQYGPKIGTEPGSLGRMNPKLAIYPFRVGGVHLFDLSDPSAPKDVAYFVPPMVGEMDQPDSYRSGINTVQVEWDRHLIWAVGEPAGVYLLSSPVLGTPHFGAMPVTEWAEPHLNAGYTPQ